jgi:hypothetical protein
MQAMRDEDDLSEDELQKQMDNNKYYSFMKNKAKKDAMKEMEKR